MDVDSNPGGAASRRNRHFFPLTGLQIGDLQSYLSRISIFLAFESKKLFILVDNQPWSVGKDASPVHLWQLMVTKARLSPFASRCSKRRTEDPQRIHFENTSASRPKKSKQLYKWFSLINTVVRNNKPLHPMKKLKNSLLFNSDLQNILYGYIIFEVSWCQIRGINYLNELQTDTSMALEAKIMNRWEFDSINHASSCISSWFLGTSHERKILEEYLDGGDFYDACGEVSNDFYGSFVNDQCFFIPDDEHESNSFRTPPAHGSHKRRKVIKSISDVSTLEESTSDICNENDNETVDSRSCSSDSEIETADISSKVTHHKDILILLRFNDPDLPFSLKKVIVSDLRLLTLLEYGLPTWVIFLQSYPVLCHVYRPWMCPLARALYVLVSLSTVLIGFYDLYKNVPILKTTAARICGPYFDWVESWEMISRLRYIGTMLFLHNFEKAVAWFLMITRAIKSVLSIVTRPIARPILDVVEIILPSWNISLEIVGMLSTVILSLVGSVYTMIMSIAQIILWPLWLIVSVLENIGTSIVQPIFWIFQKILITPITLVIGSTNFIGMICSYCISFLKDISSSVGMLLKFGSATKIPIETSEMSLLRSLWNDLFSQIFRAIRSILYGFIAFFAACNRHRLSISNYFREFFHYSNVSNRSKPTNASKSKVHTLAPRDVEEKKKN